MKATPTCSSGGATSVELLTVLAILLTLSSIILPAIQNATILTRRIQCFHNLRQWGSATHLFANDNDDYLPKDGAPNGRSRHSGWYVDLPLTLGMKPYALNPWHTNPQVRCEPSLWICPSNPRRSNGHNLFHYCLNQHVNGSGAGKQVRLSNLSAHHELVWLFDNGGLAAVAQQNNVHTNLHPDGANFLFLDGHTSFYEHSTYWDGARNRGLTDSSRLSWHPR